MAPAHHGPQRGLRAAASGIAKTKRTSSGMSLSKGPSRHEAYQGGFGYHLRGVQAGLLTQVPQPSRKAQCKREEDAENWLDEYCPGKPPQWIVPHPHCPLVVVLPFSFSDSGTEMLFAQKLCLYPPVRCLAYQLNYSSTFV